MTSLPILVSRAAATAILCLACVATLAHAQSPPAEEQSGADVIEPPPPSEAEVVRQRYQLSLVAELATRSDARQLLAAAMLAPRSSFLTKIEDVPEELRFDVLLGRAQKAGPDVPIVWWMSAMEACRHGTDKPCPESTALRHLTEIDGDNAAAWILEFLRARRAHEVDSERRALSMAARARRYDDYTWDLERLLLRAAASGPPVPVGTDHPPGLDADAIHKYVAFVTSWGVTLAVAIPPFELFNEACTQKSGATLDQALRTDCAAIGRMMGTGATSAISQYLGLKLWKQTGLLPESEFDRLLRDWNWRNRQMGPSVDLMMQDSLGIDRLQQLALESDTETDFQRSLLHEAGKPPSPPDDWQPGRPD